MKKPYIYNNNNKKKKRKEWWSYTGGGEEVPAGHLATLLPFPYHMHLQYCTYAHMGEATRGWTGPDMEAAQQLVHLSSDEEEYYCGNGAGRREAKKAAAPGTSQVGGKASTSTRREGKGSAGEELDDGDDHEGGDQDGKGIRGCSRKRRFRSIAYLYMITRPVRSHDDGAKRRKII